MNTYAAAIVARLTLRFDIENAQKQR